MRRTSPAMLSPIIALTLLISSSAAGASPLKEPPRSAFHHLRTSPVLHHPTTSTTKHHLSSPLVKHHSAVKKHPAPLHTLTRADRLEQSVDHELASDASRFHLSVPQLRQKWQHVAVCEEGGNWTLVGSVYSGIGFANSTWNTFGGTAFASRAGYASKDEQIVIGTRVTKTWIPDQYGCSPTGW
jgi:hypothetical protein